MGFFSKTFKGITKRLSGSAKIATGDIGGGIGDFSEGLGFGGTTSSGNNAAAEAAAALAETEAEKKRKLKAAEELNPTGSLGAGNPTIKRSNILGS